MLLGTSTIDYLLRSAVPAGGLTVLIREFEVFQFFLVSSTLSDSTSSHCDGDLRLHGGSGKERPRAQDTRGPVAKDDYDGPLHFHFGFQQLSSN